MIKKLITIIKSRFIKPKESEEVKRRREICSGCEYNSNNLRKLSTYKSFLTSLSNFYSYITGNKDDDVLGVCSACLCSIYFKSQFMEEDCVKGRWNKIKK